MDWEYHRSESSRTLTVEIIPVNSIIRNVTYVFPVKIVKYNFLWRFCPGALSCETWKYRTLRISALCVAKHWSTSCLTYRLQGEKTRQELLNDIIAKSKERKLEKAKSKEEQESERERLDEGMNELLGMLSQRPTKGEESAGRGPSDDYDLTMRVSAWTFFSTRPGYIFPPKADRVPWASCQVQLKPGKSTFWKVLERIMLARNGRIKRSNSATQNMGTKFFNCIVGFVYFHQAKPLICFPTSTVNDFRKPSRCTQDFEGLYDVAIDKCFWKRRLVCDTRWHFIRGRKRFSDLSVSRQILGCDE